MPPSSRLPPTQGMGKVPTSGKGEKNKDNLMLLPPSALFCRSAAGISAENTYNFAKYNFGNRQMASIKQKRFNYFILLFFQLVSEFILLSVRPEDAGVFHCSASNPAGVASANLTLRFEESLLVIMHKC